MAPGWSIAQWLHFEDQPLDKLALLVLEHFVWCPWKFSRFNVFRTKVVPWDYIAYSKQSHIFHCGRLCPRYRHTNATFVVVVGALGWPCWSLGQLELTVRSIHGNTLTNSFGSVTKYIFLGDTSLSCLMVAPITWLEVYISTELPARNIQCRQPFLLDCQWDLSHSLYQRRKNNACICFPPFVFWWTPKTAVALTPNLEASTAGICQKEPGYICHHIKCEMMKMTHNLSWDQFEQQRLVVKRVGGHLKFQVAYCAFCWPRRMGKAVRQDW